MPSLFPFLNPYMVEPPQPIKEPPLSVSLKGSVIMDQRPTIPLGLYTFPCVAFASMAHLAFRQFFALASPPSFPLTAYVYAVLGVPLTQIGALVSDLMNSYRWTCNSDCDYGSKLRTVNATDYAAPQAFVRLQVADPVGDRTRKDYEAGRRTHGASSLCLSHHCLDRCPSK